jgi:recombination protein RecA
MAAKKEKKDKKDRDVSLETVLAQIKQQYGDGAIVRLGDQDVPKTIAHIPPGALTLDLALGSGGVPNGRVF